MRLSILSLMSKNAVMSKSLSIRLNTPRCLSARTGWQTCYTPSRCLSTVTEPALFRQLEDGTEQPIIEDDLFKYQRHRWLKDDAVEQDLRYRRFNVPALVHRALNSKREPVDGKTCVKILKLLEGDHNKVLLLTMSDGDELIARLPNPNAGTSWFTVASEIATRRFVERVCDIPMPKLWDWDIRNRNTVKAEWIIESKATGVPLRQRWFGMSRQAQLHMVEQIVDLEAKLASVNFQSHGSIYLSRWLDSKKMLSANMNAQILNRDDAPPSLTERFSRQFVIGPSTDRYLFRRPNDFSKQFRGPFKDLSHYARALSRNERRYMLNNPWRKANYVTSIDLKQDTTEYLELIYKYSALQKYLIGPGVNEDPCTLSHPNLSLDNIWIDPQSEKIVCLTGWQTASITPPMLKRPYPKFLDPEFQTQSEGRDQKLPREHYRELVRVSDPLRYDRIFRNPQEFELLKAPMSVIFNAWNKRRIFLLRESLLASYRLKDTFLPKSAPDLEPFKADELERHTKEKFARQELNVLFNMIQGVQETVNIPSDGRVLSEDFERAQELSEVYRRQYIDLAAGSKGRMALHAKTWPFDSPEDENAQKMDSGSNPRRNKFSVLKKYQSASRGNSFKKIYVD